MRGIVGLRRWFIIGVLAVGCPVIGMADVLAAWDVNGVDVADGTGLNAGTASFEKSATTRGAGIKDGVLSLGFDKPSTSGNIYGFKFSSATHQTSLDGALSENHYIQFTLEALDGYRLNLDSIEMNGTSGSSGPDDIALFSSVEGFSAGDELAKLTGRQGESGGWDTDSSGWGAPIDVSEFSYQNLNSVTFRLYGWNSTGTSSAGIRNLNGDDLVINGTVISESIPEPAVIGFVAFAGIGLLISRRFRD